MFEMFLKKNTLSSKNNAFFLQKKSPVFLLSFIIALDTESLCPIYELDCQFSHSS